MLVTLGGDGTILHAVSHFSQGEVPPVVSFSMGTLGFLMPFDVDDSLQVFESVYSSQALVLHRQRLRCQIYKPYSLDLTTSSSSSSKKVDENAIFLDEQDDFFDNTSSSSNSSFLNRKQMPLKLVSTTHAMNDINIHRGPDPHLTHLDIAADGHFVTRAIADGVIIATPTGSTAYSLSSGGSIVHPSVPCTLLTPICPRSLSFRPLIFPLETKLALKVSDKNRGQTTEISIDGISKGLLGSGDRVIVEPEREGHNSGIWCVANSSGEWIARLNGLLGFNSQFGPK